LAFVSSVRAQATRYFESSPGGGVLGSAVEGTNFFDVASVEFNGVEAFFYNHASRWSPPIWFRLHVDVVFVHLKATSKPAFA
jgi:hypothetical protein